MYNSKSNSNYKLIFILSALLIIFPLRELLSQSDSVNQIKYNNYRKRLQYFVKPGTNRGESQIAGIRNRFDMGADDLNFGQHSIYFGYYIGMLATEYKLYSFSDTIKAKTSQNELKLALLQFIEYLDKSENFLFNKKENSFDGFFIRENVPCNFLENDSISEYFNQNLNPENKIKFENGVFSFENLNAGQPAWVNKISECDSIPQVFSQDEAIGLLLGLALVYKCLPDTSFEKKISKDIAIKVITYIRNSSKIYGSFLSPRWFIFKPDGTRLKTSQGGLSWFYAHGFMRTAYFFDKDYDNILKKITRYPQELFFQFGQFVASPNPDNTTMITTLAAMGDSWRATIPIIGLFFKINTTYFGIKSKTKKQDWETFYALYWAFLHDKTYKIKPLIEKTKEQLNNAPFGGTYNYGKNNCPYNTGWASSYKWHHKKNTQNGINEGILGNYNGLDYMLLFNLYRLATSNMQ
jgi:hypothetical protein